MVKRNISKSDELVINLAGYCDSTMDYGEEIAMTKLSKEIDVKGGHPHVDTVRRKLTEFFTLQDAMPEIKPTFHDGKLIRIQKVKTGELTLEKMYAELLNIKALLLKKK